MGGVTEENIDFLSFLIKHRKNKTTFLNIIENADKSEINSITEILFNFLRGNLKCNNLKKYKPHAKTIRFIANPEKNYKNRKSKIKNLAEEVVF